MNDDELTSKERGYLDAYLGQEDFGAASTTEQWRRFEASHDRRASHRRSRVIATAAFAVAAALALAWLSRAVDRMEASEAVEDAPLQEAPDLRSSVPPASVEPTPAPRRSPSVESREAPVEPEDATAAEPPRASRRRSAPEPVVTAPQPRPDLEAADVAMLQQARRRAKRGDTQGALAILERHAVRFETSVLAAQREADRLILLCRMGKATASARSRFQATSPSAALRKRVRTACD